MVISNSDNPLARKNHLRVDSPERNCLHPGFARLLLVVTTLLAAVVSVRPLHAQTPNAALLRACEAQVRGKFQQWRYAPISKEVAEFARNAKEDPTRVSGDFDGNGRKDIALLIQDGASPDAEYPRRLDSMHIAICLNTAAGFKLHLIDKPYCGDGIALKRAGEEYYDFETEKPGKYKFDAVSAYCFEKAGASYEFGNGVFHQIVDSD